MQAYTRMQFPQGVTPNGAHGMLTIYAKNEEENIPAHVLRKIKEEIDG